MKGIGDLFARIKGLQANEMFLRTAVQQALKKVANIDMDVGDVSLKGVAITVKGLSQTAKSQLFMKKGGVLKEIATQIPGRTFTDIRFS